MKLSVVSLSVGVSMAFASVALGQFGYGLVGQFNLPTGTNAWDVDATGRAWALVGNTVYSEGSAGSGAFSPFGSVPAGTVSAFGGSFIRVNDAGTMVAIGDGNFGAGASVHFVTTAALGSSPAGGAVTQSVLTGNFDGNWNGNQFYVTGAGSNFVPFVNRISFADATGLPASTTVITGIGGGSGGVAFNGGNIFTGVGYGGGGFGTGDIRSFNLLAVDAAGAGGFPTLYGTGSAIIGGPVLSASPLAFDVAGRLLVGGGDSFGGTTDIGYVAVIDLTTGVRQLLSPAGTDTTYGVDFNAAAGQIYVSDGGTVYRYAIPAPSCASVLTLGGLVALRRRRRA